LRGASTGHESHRRRFRAVLRDDEDDESLGDALAALTLDVEPDAVSFDLPED
jgi:hypothetical protein